MGSRTPVGSRTVWRQVYDDPDNAAAWDVFQNHYTTPVFSWAMKRLKNEDDAKDVTTGVFLKLMRRVKRSRAARVAPGDDGTYRQYIWSVFESALGDYFREQKSFGGRFVGRDMDEFVGSEAQTEVRQGIEAFAGFEPDLDRLEASYRAAVRGLRAGPHYSDTSFRVFLAVYRDREAGAALDGRYGWSRGMACRHARRVRARVLELMALPYGEARSEAVLELMVMRHGDPC